MTVQSGVSFYVGVFLEILYPFRFSIFSGGFYWSTTSRRLLSLPSYTLTFSGRSILFFSIIVIFFYFFYFICEFFFKKYLSDVFQKRSKINSLGME